MAAMHGIKCVAVGDGAVGKTCMLVRFATNEFPEVHVPTIFDNYAATVMVGDEKINLMLFDTAGQEDYDRLRLLCYPGTDVFVVCFSIVNPDSYLNIPLKWVPELQQHCPKVPIVLIGTQKDLREDSDLKKSMRKRKQEPVSIKQGEKLARQIGAYCYLECSALTQEGVINVFDTAILAVLQPHTPVQSHGILSCFHH